MASFSFPPLNPKHYVGNVYRNIFFCPAQDILDDIADPEDFATLDAWIQLTSGIDHQTPQHARPFQYGKMQDPNVFLVFEKERWSATRFSSGTDYGVWYAAEDEWTSIYEAAYWVYMLGKDNVLTKGETYKTDRAMYQANLSSKLAVDLTDQNDFYKLLTDPSDYNFCQHLGLELFKKGLEMLRTPSARNPRGVCTPVFAKKIIIKPMLIYYLSFSLKPSGILEIDSGKKTINTSFSAQILYESKR